jgi:hypothetical protein
MMAGGSGWDPGRPPIVCDGSTTIPEWMNSDGFGQLQVLLLQSLNEKKLNPFIVGKSLQDLVGDIDGTTTEAYGTRYVLRVRKVEQVKKLIAMKSLCDGSVVSVIPHPRLNRRRCVFSCRETQELTEEELLEGLKNNGVIEVKRILRMENGSKINTPTVIITVDGTVVPEFIKVGPLRIKTRAYIPNPTICYQCFNYGHTKFRCKSEAKCRTCSKVHSLEGDCNETAFCFHCQGNHGPSSRNCPKYLKEKEVMRLQHTKGVSYNEAIRQIQAGGGSYAAVSKVQQRLEVPSASPSVSQQLKEKDDTIKQLLDTIQQLTRRIEDLEEKQQAKKNKKRAKKDKAQEEASCSEMETDASTQHEASEQTTSGLTATQTSSKVSAPSIRSSAQKVHKRHYTTEIQPPLTKKVPLSTSINSELMQCPPNMNLDIPLKQTSHAQSNKPNK